MSDEEGSGSEYEEEAPTTPKAKHAPVGPPEKEMSEGEKIVWAAKKKMKEEEEKLYLEFMDMRKAEREKEEQALQAIRERQAERRAENDAEQDKLESLRKEHKEQRDAEEEEAQERREAEYSKRMAEKRRREQELANILGKSGPQPDAQAEAKKKSKPSGYTGEEAMGSGFGGGATRRRGPKHWVLMERRKTDEEKQVEKEHTLEKRKPKIDGVGNMSLDALKQKAEDLQSRIVKMETEKYDMEQRMQRQDYDLKELGERAKQQEKQKALKKGLNPDDVGQSKHPTKIAISSKFDRQIDSRSYDDRKKVFMKDQQAAEQPAEEAAAEEEE